MAQIEGIQRERRPHYASLQQELRNRNRVLRVRAPLGIVGKAGTGRKTLAYRLAHMDEGEFHQSIPLSYFYVPHLERTFLPEFSHIGYSRFEIDLFIYIIEEPVELPRNNPPLYWRHWNDFCCMLFVYDVKNSSTFSNVSLALASYRENNYRVPTSFIIGNKCDLRHERADLADVEMFRGAVEMFRGAAEIEAEMEGRTYYECSAKRNVDVEPILIEILQTAVARRYWMQ